ncbi:MAG: D-glycero-beta-D-manno-heptose 1-phosphate adenylyltransferase [Desulfobacteraceae bacterium]|nr:D-glycero-beta-D-manno-heptose 1-phosphate adenylyltransferase [Desulfobacteraceae bacterium]
MKRHGGYIKLGIFQFTPVPGAPAANMEKVRRAVSDLVREGSDIVLLPELWATGPIQTGWTIAFDEIAKAVIELKALACRLGVIIVGTVPEPSEGSDAQRPYDTSYAFGADGILARYRKVNLFTPMSEDVIFAPGNDPCTFWVSIKGVELGIGLITCFDLRFPELARRLIYEGAHILMVSALWPMKRRRHLETLLEARAIENQCFVAAANAWGRVQDTEFAGASCIHGPDGESIASVPDKEACISAKLDLDKINTARQNFFTAHPPRHWAPLARIKVLDLASLKKTIDRRRNAGQKIVFTNGCFDILHAGHCAYLETARRLGDALIVGLNSDESIRAIKGRGRPVNPESARAITLAGLMAVDYVVLFNEPTPIEIISALVPDVLVKGADWDEDMIAGADIVKKAGGRIARIPFEYDISTTKIIKKIVKKLT